MRTVCSGFHFYSSSKSVPPKYYMCNSDSSGRWRLRRGAVLSSDFQSPALLQRTKGFITDSWDTPLSVQKIFIQIHMKCSRSITSTTTLKKFIRLTAQNNHSHGCYSVCFFWTYGGLAQLQQPHFCAAVFHNRIGPCGAFLTFLHTRCPFMGDGHFIVPASL